MNRSVKLDNKIKYHEYVEIDHVISKIYENNNKLEYDIIKYDHIV